GVRTSTIARLSRQLVDSVHLARHGTADDRRRQADAERTLAELLLPSALAAAITPLERLTIVGLDSHGYVPFEALRRPDGRRLGTAHAIAYLPSANLGCWLARNRPAPTPAASIDLRLVACPEVVPTGSPTLQPLAFSRTERDELLHAASAANARVFLGSTATLDAALGHPTSLLEIVAHGVRDERRSDPQGIVFGDGQTAWTNDFATRQLPSWVVFAACRAGRGRFRPGDDGRHLLGGASLLAGARAVLAPHLEIDYRTTLALLGALNRGLLHDGVPFDEALRRARVAIGGDDAPVDAFLLHLHGLGDVPLVAAAGGEPRPATITQEEGGRTGWLPWLLAAAAIAAVGATVALRRRRT
ncbi:MAG: CHAT domain-containing protein, partial [Planctomycetes bacterium]|nr:CHAT domain-containing protein [Planctomycetota bacterium]